MAIWDTSQTCSDGICTTSTYSIPSGMTQYVNLGGTRVSLNGTTTAQIGAKPILLENATTIVPPPIGLTVTVP
jgi:hypothetical protein